MRRRPKMQGIVERLPTLFGLVRRYLLCEWPLGSRRDEALAMLERLEGRSEVPSLQELAELLELSRVSFASLARIQQGVALHAFPDHHDTFVSPEWILERLDLGLRALRLERGLTQAEAAEAAGFKPSELSALEDPRRREMPTLPFLDRMLLTLDASYRDLEDAVFRPLGVASKVARRAHVAQRRARPVAFEGNVLPAIVAERLDLALQSLRFQAGLSRPQLSEASGISAERLQAFEEPAGRARPSEAELRAILRALRVGPEQLEAAARRPLRGLPELTPQRRPWHRTMSRRSLRTAPPGPAPSRLARASRRLEVALEGLGTEGSAEPPHRARVEDVR